MMKKLGLLHYLTFLAVVLALIVISLILLRVPGPVRAALVPPTPGPSPTPTATPVPDGLLANVVIEYQPGIRGFHFALDQSGDPPLTKFRALVNYGKKSAATLRVDGDSPQVVIGSHIYLYGNWNPKWEEVRIDLTDPDGTNIETSYYYDYFGYIEAVFRTRMGFHADIPIGSATGTYKATVDWDGNSTTTYSFDVVQPHAPFVRLLCDIYETFNVILAGFEPGEEVRLAAYGWDDYDNRAETDTYVLLGDWAVTVGSDGSLLWLFPEDVENLYEYALIVAIGESRPVTMTDTAGKTLKVTGYDTEGCRLLVE